MVRTHPQHLCCRVAAVGILRFAAVRHQSLRLLMRCGFLLSLLVLSVGCRTGNHYHAEATYFGEQLPERFRLAQETNTQEVDLSRLAGDAVGSQTIGIGDVLKVQIAAGLSDGDQSEMAARVEDDGTIRLPDIGAISVEGIEPQAAEGLIRAEAVQKELYRNPTVTVTVTYHKTNRVRVLGAVREEGVYELPSYASDVVSALAAAGGLAENAGRHVEVRNPLLNAAQSLPPGTGGMIRPISAESASGVNSYTIDLSSAAQAVGRTYLVEDGGVVMVEKRDPEPIYVQGLVRSPNQYEFPIGKDLRLLQAISLAGGTSNQLADKIFVIRQHPESAEPLLIEVSYRKAKRSEASNIRLGPGDVISVEQTPGTVFMDALNIIRFGITGSTALF